MESNTHPEIDATLCGEPIDISEGSATVRFDATEQMRVDARGLVHGGFVFGLADYAAMLAVNDPNVVLGAAECRFVAPVAVGDEVIARATVTDEDGKRRTVKATAFVGDREVFQGTFTTFVLPKHVLDGR